MTEQNRSYKRTQLAKFGADIAVVFAAKFYETQINGYQPVLREPMGVSTGGGRQPLQHVILQPSMQQGSVITIGSVNVVERSAKIRTFRCLHEMNAQRFAGTQLPISKEGYDEFLQRVIEFFQKQGIAIEVVEQAPVMAGAPRTVPPQVQVAETNAWTLIGLFFVVVLGAAFAVWLIV